MSEQILLIDDDPLMLKVLEKVLTKAGFSVTCAKDGHEAIQKARETLFDLVISDVKMAGMDGLETLAEMNRIAPDSKKIIITGYANQDAPVKAIKLGVDDYFFKPFDAREFVRSVQASMEKYRISRERDQALQYIRDAYLAAIKSLALAIEKRSPYKEGHSARVAANALRIAKKMGFSRKRLDELELACHLHDLGEVEIKSEILDKPDVLTKEEWAQVREHPVSVRNTLGALTDLSSVLTTIRHHHERYDGTGYPDRLAGDKIPLPSRILHVAEAFDALTSSRPHRESREPQEALSVLNEEAGTQFDPEVIEAFISSFGEEEDRAQESVQDLLSDLARKSSRGLLHLARTCFSVGDRETASKAYQEILDARERMDDPDTFFLAAHDLSRIFWISGNVTKAVEMAASALDIARKNQLVLQEAKAVASLGLFNHTLGKPAQAEELLLQAMATVRNCQDVFEEAGIHLYLAYAYLGQEGKTSRVRDHLDSTLGISRLTNLGELYLRERKVLIPLLAFAFRESFHLDSLGPLISSLDKESLQALLTLMGNETHPARR
ncbi:MAG: response regulator [Armatimonadetes bacterium]|nr:response regulator [Armatimonadota bacterium]